MKKFTRRDILKATVPSSLAMMAIPVVWAEGTPEQVAKITKSHTGKYLKKVLKVYTETASMPITKNKGSRKRMSCY